MRKLEKYTMNSLVYGTEKCISSLFMYVGYPSSLYYTILKLTFAVA
jgi:hypothetical protein